MTTPAVQTTTLGNEKESTESIVQRLFKKFLPHLTIANNAELEAIRSDIDALYIDPNIAAEEAKVEVNADGIPVSYPGENATAEQMRNWYSTASDAEIATLNKARAAVANAQVAETTPAPVPVPEPAPVPAPVTEPIPGSSFGTDAPQPVQGDSVA